MKLIGSLILFTLLLLPLHGQVKTYTVDNIPNVHLQSKTQYVCNPAGILSQEVCQEMDQLLYALEQQTGIETVVAVVPSIGEADCFDFAYQLLNQWGVGKKEKDNGLVILLVTDQRCVQFCTGYGLEGDLPDAICKRIQTAYMIPYLKDANWNQGMVAGIRAVAQTLDGTMVNDTKKSSESFPLAFFAVLIGVIALAGGIGIIAIRAATRCPQCKKQTLQRSATTVVSNEAGIKVEDVTYTCRNCGNKVVRRQQSQNNNYRGGGGGGMGPLMGGFGRGSRGGGFSGGGGSFGGGRSGGGGAGSRF